MAVITGRLPYTIYSHEVHCTNTCAVRRIARKDPCGVVEQEKDWKQFAGTS